MHHLKTRGFAILWMLWLVYQRRQSLHNEKIKQLMSMAHHIEHHFSVYPPHIMGKDVRQTAGWMWPAILLPSLVTGKSVIRLPAVKEVQKLWNDPTSPYCADCDVESLLWLCLKSWNIHPAGWWILMLGILYLGSFYRRYLSRAAHHTAPSHQIVGSLLTNCYVCTLYIYVLKQQSSRRSRPQNIMYSVK